MTLLVGFVELVAVCQAAEAIAEAQLILTVI